MQLFWGIRKWLIFVFEGTVWFYILNCFFFRILTDCITLQNGVKNPILCTIWRTSSKIISKQGRSFWHKNVVSNRTFSQIMEDFCNNGLSWNVSICANTHQVYSLGHVSILRQFSRDFLDLHSISKLTKKKINSHFDVWIAKYWEFRYFM